MFGNWSKRRKMVKDAENYLKATDVVSRPVAVLMTVIAFIIIGLLLFSVFLGGRWAYHKIKGDESSVTTTTTPTSDGPGESADTENQQQEFPPITGGGVKQSGGFTATAPAASTSTSTIADTGPSVIPDTGPDETQP